MRGIGAVDLIQNLIPEWLVLAVALATQLGDAWFLFSLLAVLYWTRSENRTDILVVGGLLVAAAGLYRTLKYLFRLPRPDQPLADPGMVPQVVRPLYEVTAFASGYGFPSGHATGSTVVYLGLAAVLTVGTRRKRYGVAAVLITLVSFSRVALGVHFLVDVVAGVVLGSTFLFGMFWLLDRIGDVPEDRITVVLVAATVLNGTYLLASEFHYQAVGIFGVTVCLLCGWQFVYRRGMAALGPPS